ncbi:MAG: GDP-L-fucose synthase family protein [Myxococcota bacterium]
MAPDAPIYVAGHTGLVGSAIVRRLEAEGFGNLLLATSAELDLRDQSLVDAWFEAYRPAYVFLVAGTVGGVLENDTYPAEFLYDNLMIHCTVVDAAYRQGVEKLLYLGSSCVYPRHAPQPIREEHLLSGALEPTNEAYAIAKIAGIKLCAAYKRQYGCNFVSAMPTNLYGPGDNFDLQSSHVMPALMRKLHEAKLKGEREMVVWGSGSPLREFMHVDDLADCCLFLMRNYEGEEHINVGTGEEISIGAVAELLLDIIHPEAKIVFDASKPDGTPQLEALGWRHQIALRDGLESTYAWFIEHYDEIARHPRERARTRRSRQR